MPARGILSITSVTAVVVLKQSSTTAEAFFCAVLFLTGPQYFRDEIELEAGSRVRALLLTSGYILLGIVAPCLFSTITVFPPAALR